VAYQGSCSTMQKSPRSRFCLASAIAIAAASSLLLSACASNGPREVSSRKHSKEYFPESIYGVKASPRVTNLRTNLPRGGGRDQTGKPYMVKGQWYYPREEKSYRKVGGASWYGDAFHGRLTANGEIYDMTHLTAAHPTMPLPSYARVTNMANGNSVIVRVNDRGPYEKGRIIDLSHRAAEMLDYAHAGMASVKVEYVGRAPLDGHDDKFLVASYRPGKGAQQPPLNEGLPTGVMIAMNGPQPTDGAVRQPQLPFALKPAADTAAPTTVAAVSLPSAGPIAPQRPAEAPRNIPFAVMGYAGAETEAPAKGLAAFDRASASGSYVLAGTFAGRAGAQALAARLDAFGRVAVSKSGRNAWSVTLRGDGRVSADEMLQAAWANGAPDAMTVREEQ
jgi:rare lipoprotein A